jgi:hypothetical protein
MPHIVLSPEQASILEQAIEPVEFRDAQGRILARILSPIDEAALAEVRRRRRRNNPSYPAAEVRGRLEKLQQISRREPLDQAKVRDLLRRMRAGEEV